MARRVVAIARHAIYRLSPPTSSPPPPAPSTLSLSSMLVLIMIIIIFGSCFSSSVFLPVTATSVRVNNASRVVVKHAGDIVRLTSLLSPTTTTLSPLVVAHLGNNTRVLKIGQFKRRNAHNRLNVVESREGMAPSKFESVKASKKDGDKREVFEKRVGYLIGKSNDVYRSREESRAYVSSTAAPTTSDFGHPNHHQPSLVRSETRLVDASLSLPALTAALPMHHFGSIATPLVENGKLKAFLEDQDDDGEVDDIYRRHSSPSFKRLARSKATQSLHWNGFNDRGVYGPDYAPEIERRVSLAEDVKPEIEPRASLAEDVKYESVSHSLPQPLAQSNSGLSVSHTNQINSSPPSVESLNGYSFGHQGRMWRDFPSFSSVPHTSFGCPGYGFFADVETGCQAWHYCQPDGRRDSFLCANATLFNQETRVCDWWYKVDCFGSSRFFGNNHDLYRVTPPVPTIVIGGGQVYPPIPLATASATPIEVPLRNYAGETSFDAANDSQTIGQLYKIFDLKR